VASSTGRSAVLRLLISPRAQSRRRCRLAMRCGVNSRQPDYWVHDVIDQRCAVPSPAPVMIATFCSEAMANLPNILSGHRPPFGSIGHAHAMTICFSQSYGQSKASRHICTERFFAEHLLTRPRLRRGRMTSWLRTFTHCRPDIRSLAYLDGYLRSVGVTSFNLPVDKSITNPRITTSEGIHGCDLSFSTCLCVA
jgi:hypothetical protein